MLKSCVRYYIALALPVLLLATNLRAEYFTGSTYINFDTRGKTSYNLSIEASIMVPGSPWDYAWADVSFGDLSGSSYSYTGEVWVGINLNNIRKVGTEWVAETVDVIEYSGATSSYEYRSYTELPVSSASWVNGDAHCAGNTQAVQGYIEGF